MPGPTRAPDRDVRPGQPRHAGRRPAGISAERAARLRRTGVLAVLALLVIWLLARALDGDGDAATPPPPATTSAAAPSTSTSPTGSDPSRSDSSTTASSAPTVVEHGDGEITALPVPGEDTDTGGRTVTFSVEAEGGLGIDLEEYARSVREILSDTRGWESEDGIHFKAVSPAQITAGSTPAIRITLASPDLTDRLCAPLRTKGEVSCNQGGRAVINAKRWITGVKYYDDLGDYRVYLINHEVGHGLWHQHESCPGEGKRAPVMVQQSLGLQGCTAWPYPVMD